MDNSSGEKGRDRARVGYRNTVACREKTKLKKRMTMITKRGTVSVCVCVCERERERERKRERERERERERKREKERERERDYRLLRIY